MISSRERNYLKRLNGVARKSEYVTVDLFREAEIAERRRRHLRIVICRLAVRLRIETPHGLETKSESELNTIRRELSRRIAESKRPKSEELAA